VIPSTAGSSIEQLPDERPSVTVKRKPPQAPASVKPRKTGAADTAKKVKLASDYIDLLSNIFSNFMTKPAGPLPSKGEIEDAQRKYPMLASLSAQKIKDAVRNKRVSLARANTRADH
jgi:hypothetical protein